MCDQCKRARIMVNGWAHVCVVCGERFTAVQKRRRLCSQRCQRHFSKYGTNVPIRPRRESQLPRDLAMWRDWMLSGSPRLGYAAIARAHSVSATRARQIILRTNRNLSRLVALRGGDMALNSDLWVMHAEGATLVKCAKTYGVSPNRAASIVRQIDFAWKKLAYGWPTESTFAGTLCKDGRWYPWRRWGPGLYEPPPGRTGGK